jgi:hypothetical protein
MPPPAAFVVARLVCPMTSTWPFRFLRPLRRRGLLPWLIFLAACLALVVGHWRAETQKLRAESAEREHRRQFFQLYQAVMPYYLKSPEEFAAGLTGGQALRGHSEVLAYDVIIPPIWFGMTAEAPQEEAVIRTAGRVESFRVELSGKELGGGEGWRVNLHFIDRKLLGAAAVGPPRVPYAGPSASWHAMRVIRRAAFWCGVAVWFGCALIVWFNLPWRRQIAQVALAGAVLSSVCWWIGPERQRFSPGVRDGVDYGLVGGAAVWLPSIVVRGRNRLRRARGAPHCAGCGYDLTGNVSGVCPECGRLTPQGLIDRWRRIAERIERVEDEWDDALSVRFDAPAEDAPPADEQYAAPELMTALKR